MNNLSQFEKILLLTSLRNELANRERLCQDIGISERQLNVQDLRSLIEKLETN